MLETRQALRSDNKPDVPNKQGMIAPNMTQLLKLAALDGSDLEVVSAHCQDAVLKSAEVNFSPSSKRLLLPINRFAWEAPASRRWFFKKYERRRSVLHIDLASSVRSKGLNKTDPEEVRSILSIDFHPDEDENSAGGTIDIVFAGGANLLIEVEALEMRLTDLGAVWAANSKPRHKI